MAVKGWSVGRVAEVLGFARSASRGRDERVVIHVLVERGCPGGLALAVRRALASERPGGEVRVFDLARAPQSPDDCDAAVILVGDGADGRVACRYALSGVPVALIVEGALEAPRLDLGQGPASLVSIVAASSPETLPERLAEWLVRSVDKGVALAANFPFCRDAVVRALISRCAAENAAVGAVRLIPGSDLPVMTANQIKLALDIAACHGRSLEPSRALEAVGVACAGIGWRAAARLLLGLVPGAGPLLRAGVAFGGTLATGAALRLRFAIEPGPRRARTPRRTESPAAVELAPGLPEREDYVTIGEVRR